MDKNFIHLQVHTEFSLSKGLITIPKLIKKVADLNMPACAITDLNNFYGAIKFYEEAIKNGIKPLLGVNLTVADHAKTKHLYQLTLLCQNHKGYLNLLTLLSKAYLIGQKAGQPLVLKSWLKDHAEGLIALSSGLEGALNSTLVHQSPDEAILKLKQFNDLFPDRYYLEISKIGKEGEAHYHQRLLKLAYEYSIPIVATNHVCFLEKEDFEAHEARVAIQAGVTLNNPQRERCYTDQQYLRSPAEMWALFAHSQEALLNTFEIAKRCNVLLTLYQNKLPHFQVPANYSTESYLTKVAKAGLKERLNAAIRINPKLDLNAYHTRLDRELTVINNMGFAGYFLIVADFTRWAKENAIPVGPGRGSGSGSLVAYALAITGLDPLALDLLFERFLNPERVSMPDFDIDFCMDGRDRVIEYVIQKHGQDNVAQIITYGTMAAKAVIRDVGRVLGMPYGFVDKIAKLIPFELGITLEKALSQEPLLKERYNQEDEVRTLIDLALKLEGITRNVGTHAGGIVIAPGKLTDFVPLYCEVNDAHHPVTQFDKDDVEKVGLVKFDFLGLKTLTIIDRALSTINAKEKTPINIDLIPLDDALTFNQLKACQTIAVFQLESPGMRDIIKRLQPDCFDDLMALVALFRPGPLQSGMVDDFINRKHGRAKVIYPHPKLEPVLKSTYGVILYQEQVMQIAQVLAGYSLGKADILRRAMGKKKPEEMAQQREFFCQGAIQQGVDEKLANNIFDLMEKFAGYGFNKSHSAAYALIAYQTAWLKAHYPAAFMAAVLSVDMDRTDKIILFLNECKSLHLTIIPPDINRSEYYFKVVDEKTILYGLGAIKGLGEGAIESIVAAHQTQPFSNLYDFCERTDMRKINKRSLEALIKSGCFDLLEKNRAELLANIAQACLHAEQRLQNQLCGQQDLLSDITPNRPTISAPPIAWDESTQLQGEKDTLGFYLSGHPLDRHQGELKQFITCHLKEITKDHHRIRVAGIISNLRTRQTKRGDKLAIFILDDGSHQREVVCFADIYQKRRHLLIEDQILIIDGEVSIDDYTQSLRIVSKDLYSLNEARERFAQSLEISLSSEHLFDPKILQYHLTKHLGGKCQVKIRIRKSQTEAMIQLGPNWLIKPSEQLIRTIQSEFTISDIQFIY